MKGMIEKIIFGNKKDWIKVENGDCYILVVGKKLLQIERINDNVRVKGIK